MSLHVKAGGSWQTTNNVYAKVNGSWKQIKQVYVKVNGVWKQIWSYVYTKTDVLPTLVTGASSASKAYSSIISGSTVTVYGIIKGSVDGVNDISVYFNGASKCVLNSVNDTSCNVTVSVKTNGTTPYIYLPYSFLANNWNAFSVNTTFTATVTVPSTSLTISITDESNNGQNLSLSGTVSYQTTIS